jgi:hypothetical protein
VAQQQKPDEGLFVEFYLGTIEDPVASKTAKQGALEHPELPKETFKGYPVFKEVPFCRVVVPGNKDEMVDGPAWIDERNPFAQNNRFPHAWARFKAGETEGVSGTPLKEWAQCTRSHVEQLAFFKIRTVEQLASTHDGNLGHLGPGYLALRQKAREHLEQANSNETLKSELDKLKAQLAALTAPLAPTAPESPRETQAAPVAPKRRGRPPKAADVVQG